MQWFLKEWRFWFWKTNNSKKKRVLWNLVFKEVRTSNLHVYWRIFDDSKPLWIVLKSLGINLANFQRFSNLIYGFKTWYATYGPRTSEVTKKINMNMIIQKSNDFFLILSYFHRSNDKSILLQNHLRKQYKKVENSHCPHYQYKIQDWRGTYIIHRLTIRQEIYQKKLCTLWVVSGERLIPHDSKSHTCHW